MEKEIFLTFSLSSSSSTGSAFGGEPSNGIASGVMVFEHSFEFLNKVGEGSDGDDSARDSALSEGGCPSEGRSFGHIGQGEGNLLVIIIIDFVIDEEIKLYSIKPLGGLFVGSVKGFWCSDMEFSGFQRGHRQGRSGE